jgi:hypothetical protein
VRDHRHVSTRTLVWEVYRGRDGKRYPVRVLSKGELARLRRLVHQWHCADGWTYRKVERELLDRYGIKRSQGSIAADLTRWRCQHCRKPPAAPVAPQQPSPARATVHPWR